MRGFRKFGYPFGIYRRFQRFGGGQRRFIPLYPNLIEQAFGSSLIGYWKQNEADGLIAYDSSPQLNNGAYTAVTLSNNNLPAQIGGRAPLFDGANSYDNIYSAEYNADYSGSEGTFAIWARVFNSGVWTDGVFRYAFRVLADANNRIYIARNAANNQLIYQYKSGGVQKNFTVAATSTDWMHLCLTWSASNDRARAYYNGVQQGVDGVGLGAYVGNLSSTATCIGSGNTTPAQVWYGWLGHAVSLNREATPAEVANLANFFT